MSPNSGAGSLPDVGVVIAAAGRGVRAGGTVPKQLREIAGVPMLLRAIRPFAAHPRVGRIAVALPEELAVAPPDWLAAVAGDRLRLVPGGTARADSVFAALGALDGELAIVLVHDAARPFVSSETVDAVIESAAAGLSAVPAVPVSDTLKRVGPDGSRVLETVDRAPLWRAQTPQGFPREVLEAAFAAAGADARGGYTDESAMVEAAGFPVVVVPDRAGNLKVTTEDDFAMAEFLAGRR
jgi:2-C-methyl-D-erythritol 4-phosphate cytidylyltransferase